MLDRPGVRRTTRDIYGGKDPLDLPAYTVPEIAHCLQVPPATLRSWTLGRTYRSSEGIRTFRPLIEIADGRTQSLSFRNVVELHVLSAIRRRHGVKMLAVRRAIQFLAKKLGIDHPLAAQEMATDGKDLFIDRYGQLLNISQDGQLEMKELVSVYLSRIDRDAVGLPVRLYPFTMSRVGLESPKSVAMNPRVQFGRPCIAGTGIPTSVIADRYKAGDTIEELAHDYGQEPATIEEAIRYEFPGRAA